MSKRKSLFASFFSSSDSPPAAASVPPIPSSLSDSSLPPGCSFEARQVLSHGVPVDASSIAHDCTQGLCAIGSSSGFVHVFGRHGLQRCSSKQLDGPITHISFLPLLSSIVVACDAVSPVAALYSATDLSLLACVPMPDTITCLFCDPSSSPFVFLGTDGGAVHVLDCSRRCLSTYTIAPFFIIGVSASDVEDAPAVVAAAPCPADPRILFVANAAGNTIFWDLKSKRVLHRLQPQHPPVPLTCAAWSPNGKHVAVGNQAGQVCVYRADKDDVKPDKVLLAQDSAPGRRPIDAVWWFYTQLEKGDAQQVIVALGGNSLEATFAPHSCTLFQGPKLDARRIIPFVSPAISCVSLRSTIWHIEESPLTAILTLHTNSSAILHPLADPPTPPSPLLPWLTPSHPITHFHCAPCSASTHALTSSLGNPSPSTPCLIGGSVSNCPPSLMPPLPAFAVAVSTTSSGIPTVSLYNISAAPLTPVCRLIWTHTALASLQPSSPPEASDIRSYFLGDQNGVVITTSKCFLLAVHKGVDSCHVKLQRLTSSEASVVTAGSTVTTGGGSQTTGGGSQVSDEGDTSIVMVPRAASDSLVAVAAAGGSCGDSIGPLSARLFKRSSVLGRVSWTLQLMNLDGSVLSYTNKDGKRKTYDLTACTVAALQSRDSKSDPTPFLLQLSHGSFGDKPLSLACYDDAALQLWQASLKFAASLPPAAACSTAHPPSLLTKTSSIDDMIGPPSPYPDSVVSVSLGGGSTEELVDDSEAAAAAASEVLLPFDVQPGLQPDACVITTHNSRITAWAVDTWASDGPILAIATSAGDLAVYTLNDMRRRYHMSNVTALLMPHELMSCPDFTGHVIISITAVYSPAQTVASVPSDARASSQALLLLGLSCGIVIAVDAASGSCVGRACDVQKPSPLVSVLVTDDMGYAAWAGSSEAASPNPGCPPLPPQPRPAAPLSPPTASRLIVVSLEHTRIYTLPDCRCIVSSTNSICPSEAVLVTCLQESSSGSSRRPFLLTHSPDSTLSLNSLFHLKQIALLEDAALSNRGLVSRDCLSWLPDGRCLCVTDNGAGVTRCSLFSNENSLHLPLLLPHLFSSDVKPPEKPREKSGLKSLFSMKADVDYLAIFESGTPQAQAAAAGKGGGAAGGAGATVASANSAAADARDALIQRGEKLSQLSDRVGSLAVESQKARESLAEYNKRQAAKKWWEL